MYTRELLDAIQDFRKGCPIHFVPIEDKWKPRIKVYIGDQREYLQINPEIAIRDQITLLDRQLRKFYPQYKVVSTTESVLDPMEIAELIREGHSYDDACQRVKPVSCESRGIIEQFWLLDDRYRIRLWDRQGDQVNEDVVTRNTRIPISEFLAHLRAMRDDKEILDYIDRNSRYEQISIPPQVLVNYEGPRLLNFIRINSVDIQEPPVFTRVDENTQMVTWGRFKFSLDSRDPVFPDAITLCKSPVYSKS